MPDSRLNETERALQQLFRKLLNLNGLLIAVVVLAVYRPMHRLPDRRVLPPAVVGLRFEPVSLADAKSPLRLAGAWVLHAEERRFGGLSALAIDEGRFLALSDLGAVVRFDFPAAPRPQAELVDLAIGPGNFGKKWSRDAESIARDPIGRGWWVGYEQNHSLWLYDDGFNRSAAQVDLGKSNWRDNRGAEGLVVRNGQLLVLAENGRDAVEIGRMGPQLQKLYVDAEVADAARAQDGSSWLLLRKKGLRGIEQSIAYLQKTHDGYRSGSAWPVPKAPLDNYEGMAIQPLPDRWRFWLITDDGHRIMARTLLVALDLAAPIRNDKGPATRTGPSKQTSSK